jgi:hypothetical protein
MATDFTPNITQVQTLNRFNRAGTTDKVTQVTFFVGAFGPFHNDFAAGQDTPALINAYVDAKAAELRQIVNRG